MDPESISKLFPKGLFDFDELEVVTCGEASMPVSNTDNEELQGTKEVVKCICCWDHRLKKDTAACLREHPYCMPCFEALIRSKVEDGANTFACIEHYCGERFNIQTLEKHLDKNLFAVILRRVHEWEVREAGLENMVWCPSCPFAAELDPLQPVLCCQNPDCQRRTCRTCFRETKDGDTCQHREGLVKQYQEYIEDEMSKSIIRICFSCNSRFIKDEGCNEVVCPCGAEICYGCRRSLAECEGLCRSSGSPDIISRKHDEEAIEGGQRARKRFLLEHPEARAMKLVEEPIEKLLYRAVDPKNTGEESRRNAKSSFRPTAWTVPSDAENGRHNILLSAYNATNMYNNVTCIRGMPVFPTASLPIPPLFQQQHNWLASMAPMAVHDPQLRSISRRDLYPVALPHAHVPSQPTFISAQNEYRTTQEPSVFAGRYATVPPVRQPLQLPVRPVIKTETNLSPHSRNCEIKNNAQAHNSWQSLPQRSFGHDFSTGVHHDPQAGRFPVPNTHRGVGPIARVGQGYQTRADYSWGAPDLSPGALASMLHIPSNIIPFQGRFDPVTSSFSYAPAVKRYKNAVKLGPGGIPQPVVFREQAAPMQRNCMLNGATTQQRSNLSNIADTSLPLVSDTRSNYAWQRYMHDIAQPRNSTSSQLEATGSLIPHSYEIHSYEQL